MKNLFISLLTLLTTGVVTGQNNANVGNPDSLSYTNIEGYKKDIYSPNANFYLINDRMQNVINNYDTTQGLSSLKEYTRLYKFWNTRVGSDPAHPGNFNDYNNIMANYSLNLPQCETYFTPNWINIGSKFINYTPTGDTRSFNGLIHAVYMNPNNTNEIIVGTSSSGIFRTTDQGLNWTCVTDDLNIPGMGIGDFAVNPLNPNTIIASTGKYTYNQTYGTGILISHDGGVTWARIQNFPSSNYPVTIKTIFNPSDTTQLLTITRKNLFYSPDYGVSWFSIFEIDDNLPYVNTNAQILNDIVMTSDGVIFLGGVKLWDNSTQIWKTNINNTPLNWVDITSTFSNISPLNNTGLLEVSFSKIVNNRFYVYLGDGNSNYYYKTTDNGSSFSYFSNSGGGSGGSNKIGLSQSLTRDAIYSGITVPYYVTQNSYNYMGIGYWDVNWHADIRCTQSLIDQNTNHELVLYGNDGGLQIFDVTNATTYPYYNTNKIVTFPLMINQSYDLAVSQFDNNVDDFNDLNHLMIGNQDNGTHTYDFYNQNWNILHDYDLYGDGGQCWISSDNTRKLSVQNDEIHHILNGISPDYTSFSGWSLNMVAEVDEKHDALYYVNIGSTDPNTGAVTTPLHIYKKDNNIVTDLSMSVPYLKEISELAFAESDFNVVYFSGGASNGGTTGNQLHDNKFFKSVDGLNSFINLSASTVVGPGGTQTLKQVLSWKKICAISVNPANPDELWVGISGVPKASSTASNLYRVLHSTDGGLNWVDYSEGLPLLPVNCIKYVKGTNNLLMVGTDIGVYVRQEGDTHWHCFKGDLPPAIVTGIDIDYCDRNIYISTYGRGVWETQFPTSDYFKISPEHPELIIRNNQSIEETYNCVSSIVIEPNATLTVTGTLYMNKDSRIIVKPGGKLIVNGGTITNGCNGLWEGIFVNGVKSDIYQNETVQGQAIFTDATIEHALGAVRNYGLKPNLDEIDYNTTGGIIQATNTDFTNNHRSVVFMYYERVSPYNSNLIYADKSYFNDCNFLWNDNLRSKGNEMVSMWKVHGIRYRNCSFLDNRQNITSAWITNSSKAYSGIVSADAYYYIYNSTFTNLDFGIWAQNHSTEKHINVRNSTFTNNLYGIELVEVDYPVCLKNTFIVNDNNNHIASTGWKQIGIHAIATNQIRFEENEFYDNSTAGIRTVGIVCSDIGTMDTRTYKNYFYNMDYGTVAQGLNRSVGASDGETGLYFECNENHATPYRDHLVLDNLWGGATNPTYGVKSIFGSSQHPIGNTFTQFGQQYEDFYNTPATNLIGYWYSTPNATLEQPVETYNVFYSGSPGGLTNQCPSKIKVIGGTKPYLPLTATEKSQAVNDFNTSTTALAQKKNELTNLVDGGNTQALLTQVANLTPQNKFQLRQTLLGYSPYVSVDVVKATIDNPPSKYPHWWAFELVLANIDVARQPGFMDFLANKQYPMPYWMRWTINFFAQNAEATPLFEKQTEISSLSTQRSLASEMLIRDFRQDTTGVKIDSIIYWTEQQGDQMYKFRKVDLLLEKGQYEQAQVILNQIDPDTYPAELKQRVIDLITLKTRIRSILTQKGSLAQMSKDDHLFFTQMAENGVGSAKYQAQGIVCFFFDECKAYPLDLPYGNNQKVMQPTIEEEQPDIELSFKMYPNPANDWVAIELPLEVQGAIITIVDLNGKVILQERTNIPMYIWTTNNMTEGVYIVNITNLDGTQKIGTQKIIIQH